MTEQAVKGAAAAEVKSAARALDLLDDLATHGPATQLQLSQRLGIPKSSLHALLRTMVARGWLETDPTGSVYRLGIHALLVGSAYPEGDPVLARVAPLMDEVAAATGETVHLGRLEGPHVVYVATRESTHPLRIQAGVGRRFPACSTALGRAILAEQLPEVRERLVTDDIESLTPQTTTERAAVLELLGTAATLGYAMESEECYLGVRCFAVALPLGRESRDALDVAVPLARLDQAREDHIVETLLGVRERLSPTHDQGPAG
jgi:DNA-binding IclR family transcriptional regulator